MTPSDIYLQIVINIIIFILGIIIGLFINRSNNSFSHTEKPKSFFDQNKDTEKPASKITIDDTKFVVQIKTDDLQKKYDTLGDVKQSQENISDSVNKLKNLKK